MKKLDPRRLARGVALQSLYELDATEHAREEVIGFRDDASLRNIDARLLGYLILRSHYEDTDSRDEDDLSLLTPTSEALISPQDQQRTLRLVNGVLEHKIRLDAAIYRFSPEYPIDQMAVVDRNILRIALYEFAVSRETPVTVAINEAVELAKIFGGDSTAAFVNGVLGSLATHQEALRQEFTAQPQDTPKE